jgi:hypothetical protein
MTAGLRRGGKQNVCGIFSLPYLTATIKPPKRGYLEKPCERRFAASTIERLRSMRFIAKSGNHLFTTTNWARA